MASTSSKIQGIILEIGGDTSKLQQALKEVDTQLNSTTKSLKDVDKWLKLDPTNIELLKQKWEYLTKSISDTQDKLKLLKDIQQQADTNVVDKESEQYKELVRQIEATSITLKKLASSKDEVTNKVKELGGNVDELTDEEKKLATQTNKTNKETKNSKTAFNAAAQNLRNYIEIAEKVAKVAVQIVKSFVSMATEAADSAKQIEKLSKQTSLSTDEVQELAYVAEICGVNLDIITKTVKQNIKSISEASKYNFDYMEGYEALGVSIYDTNGELRDSGDIYWDTIDALRAMEASTQRDIIAEQLLGRKATDLNEIFSLSNEEFQALRQEAHDIGYVLDQETVEALSDLDSQLTKSQKSWVATKTLLVAQLAPALEMAGGFVSDFLSEINALLKGDMQVDEMIESLADKITNGVTFLLNKTIENLPQILTGAFKGGVTLISSIADMLANLDWSKLITNLITSIVDIVLNQLPVLMYNISDSLWKLTWQLFDDLLSGKLFIEIGKMAANLGISLANGIIEGLNKLGNFTIPGLTLMGKKLWDDINVKLFTIPKIPMLAKGGVLSSGSAIVGEAGAELLTNVGGKSVVTPLTNPNSNALAAATTQTNQVITINFTGSLSQLAKILQPEIEKENVRMGVSLVG